MKVKACTAVCCMAYLLHPTQTAAFVGNGRSFVPLSILNATPTPSTASSPLQTSSSNENSSRRSFIQKSGTAFIAATIATDSIVNNLLDTPTQCTCTKCVGLGDDDDHGHGCSCTSCSKFQNVRYGPKAAVAATYDTKEEAGSGAAQRSPDYYAQVIQMKETNARLEASGYKLDTREEEQSKINNAFASFSYDDVASSSSKSLSKKKGSKKESETKKQ